MKIAPKQGENLVICKPNGQAKRFRCMSNVVRFSSEVGSMFSMLTNIYIRRAGKLTSTHKKGLHLQFLTVFH